ncbi:MAG: hypothetical protein IPL10_08405 [Bacteroidetes bacterium]|jgi:hypothetical protein|nr:hypothetical protein [Bacteroidota bacterium]
MNILTKNSTTVISRKEIPNVITVILNSDHIIEVKWSEALTEIEKEHLINLTTIIKELGHGKKMLVYIDTYNFMAITSEAREYAATKEASQYTLANAVLVDALPKKILFNFYMKINKPVVQTKGFSAKESAMNWLKEWQF